MPPFGWRTAPAPDNPKRKVLALNEAEAATIRKAVELVVDERLSCWDAAAKLNALGQYPRGSVRNGARIGTRWENTNLRRMLHGSYFAGEYVLHTDGGNFTIRGPEIISAHRLRDLQQRRPRPRPAPGPATASTRSPAG